MYGRIVGLVILLFMFETFFFYGWAFAMYGDAASGALCSSAQSHGYFGSWDSKPKRIAERAAPDTNGINCMSLRQSGSLQTPMPTRFDRHLIRDDSALDVPSTIASWVVFTLTIIISIGLWAAIIVSEIAMMLAFSHSFGDCRWI